MVNLSFSLWDLEYFLLVMVRVTCFVSVAPFFGMTNTPNRVKIGLSIFISYIIYQMLDPVNVPYHSIVGFTVIVIKEALVGLLIGFSANICTSILNFAGHLVDMETGLSMASLFDPVSKESLTLTGMYYQYTVTLMLLISGMYQYVLAALCESFSLIPVNGAIFASDKLVNAIAVFFKDYLLLGFRLCMPVFVVILLLNAILGVLAKVSPQLNMFAVGIQLKILVGFGVLYLTVGMLPTASTVIMSEMRKIVTIITEAMQ